MLVNPFPRFTSDNVAYCNKSYVHSNGYLFVGKPLISEHPDLTNPMYAQSSAVNIFPVLVAALFKGISNIVHPIANEQMRNPHTRRVVTVVANMLVFRKWSMQGLPCGSMSRDSVSISVSSDPPVAENAPRQGPFYALVGVVRNYLKKIFQCLAVVYRPQMDGTNALCVATSPQNDVIISNSPIVEDIGHATHDLSGQRSVLYPSRIGPFSTGVKGPRAQWFVFLKGINHSLQEFKVGKIRVWHEFSLTLLHRPRNRYQRFGAFFIIGQEARICF